MWPFHVTYSHGLLWLSMQDGHSWVPKASVQGSNKITGEQKLHKCYFYQNLSLEAVESMWPMGEDI